MRTLFQLTLLAALVAGIGVQSASAQSSRYDRQVDRQLDRLDRMLNDEGYDGSYDRRYGWLRDDARDSFTVYLRAGQEYYFFGVCDNDCSDLDLRLFSPTGGLVDSDTATDDTPHVSVRPRRSGTYRVQSHMYDCDTQPCRYGVSLIRG
ncbi:MAG: hypothetical protein AAF624_12785 [Bacteroidota bacterium]